MEVADDSECVVDVTTDDEAAYMPIDVSLSESELEARRLKSKQRNLRAIEAKLAKHEAVLQRERRRAESKISDIVEGVLECPVCQSALSDLYILQECGHTFCCKCLQECFTYQKSVFVPNDLEAQNREEVVESIFADLNTSITEMKPREIAHLLHPSQFAKPMYNCPTCRAAVPVRPTKNTVLEDIVHTLHGLDRNDDEPNPWNEHFPCVLD